MNELISLVSSKTGLSEDKAQMAVTAVLGFLKNRLPAPIAGQVESFLSQNSESAAAASASGEEGGLLQSLGKKIGL